MSELTTEVIVDQNFPQDVYEEAEVSEPDKLAPI